MSETPNHDYMMALWKRYHDLKAERLDLDMTRGKPCPAQLALSWDMLRITSTHSRGGIDCCNYGHLEGLPDARVFCARFLGTNPKNTLVLGNSSLQLMHDVIVQKMLRGGWPAKRKFLCPVPGYDRPFKICEFYGIDMIPVPLLENGPDMNVVKEYAKDPSVVGIWCIPKYSNPTGITYSSAVTRELLTMKTGCSGFIMIWDNAYAHHDLTGIPTRAPDIATLAREARASDRVWIFGSTSKVTFASAGLAMMASSERNIEWFKQSLSVQTIGPDKLNQLRHVRFLKNMSGVRAHMRKHRRIIGPKFQAVYDGLEGGIGGMGVAEWTKPDGGYFISLQMKVGSAKRVVQLAAGVGLKLTPAGAAFPYSADPADSHIRIAPTFPDTEEVRTASRVLSICAELAHRESHPQTSVR